MQGYSKLFFVVLLAHTLRSGFISPVVCTDVDVDKDSTRTDRLVVNKFWKERVGYKSYVHQLEEKTYANVEHVFFGDRELLTKGSPMACKYVNYVRVYWKGDLAPVMLKFKYYDWVWNFKNWYLVLTPELDWESRDVASIKEQDPDEYNKKFAERMKYHTPNLTDELLGTFKPFKDTAREVKPAGPTEEQKAEKKKYVLMVVVVVVFVVVASLVVFLVKFCLK